MHELGRLDAHAARCGGPSFVVCASSARDRRRLGRRDDFRTDRDHLSQASLGAVDEDGGVDVGNLFFWAHLQFCERIGVGGRVGGTRCALNANAGQQDSQIGLN